ncbi:MAG: hypothetical protein A2Y53_08600 [Chloroflexi bacterium RBG_16_47_49]|nr:MAG: hypothetical protein A2Y53_08600 [Chloroflexi bacterium RBG_16_47_49]
MILVFVNQCSSVPISDLLVRLIFTDMVFITNYPWRGNGDLHIPHKLFTNCSRRRKELNGIEFLQEQFISLNYLLPPPQKCIRSDSFFYGSNILIPKYVIKPPQGRLWQA